MTRHKSAGYGCWVVLLVFLSDAACFRGFDSAKVLCTETKYCPDGYFCSKGQCVRTSDDAVIDGGGSSGGDMLPSSGSGGDRGGDADSDGAAGRGGGTDFDGAAGRVGGSDLGGGSGGRNGDAGLAQATDGSPWLSDAPASPSDSSNDSSCKSDEDCASDYCVDGGCCETAGCAKPCTEPTDCAGGTYCDTASATCLPKKGLGQPARLGEECVLGVVADGVCCDEDCRGCNACTADLNGRAASTTGQCLPVKAGYPAPHNACTAAPPCGLDGKCDGSGACRYTPADTPCGTDACTGSTLTTHLCDGTLHTCVPYSRACPNSLICASATACKTDCTEDDDCDERNHCASGACRLKEADAQPCTRDGQCENGHCVSGVCCHTACSTCNSCSTGTCEPADNGKSCGSGQFCNGGTCGPCPDGSSCNPDGNLCQTGAISCATGVAVCQMPKNVAAGNSCGASRVCDGSGSCVACTYGTACTSNPCEVQSNAISCSTGVSTCFVTGTKPAGESCGTGKVCNASNQCETANTAPVVNAGADLSITLQSTLSINGTVNDDGLPTPPAITILWSKTSGPGTVSFSPDNAGSTMVTFSKAGTYVLRLSASDGALSAYDELVVTVNDGNTAPVVNAGPDRSVTLPSTLSITGTVTDDGLPTGSTLNIIWSRTSGPGSVYFTPGNTTTTTARFSDAGTYVLRLTVSDGALSAYDELQVTVNDGNTAPVVNAGPNRSVTLPSSLSITGTVTDDGLPAGSTLNIIWSRTSGPGSVYFTPGNTTTTNVSFSNAGTYVLRLTVSDGALSAYDELQVTVSAAAAAPQINADDGRSVPLPPP